MIDELKPREQKAYVRSKMQVNFSKFLTEVKT